jgi:hypothetical protein
VLIADVSNFDNWVSEATKGKRLLEHPGVVGRIIFRWGFGKWDVGGVWIGSS